MPSASICQPSWLLPWSLLLEPHCSWNLDGDQNLPVSRTLMKMTFSISSNMFGLTMKNSSRVTEREQSLLALLLHLCEFILPVVTSCCLLTSSQVQCIFSFCWRDKHFLLFYALSIPRCRMQFVAKSAHLWLHHLKSSMRRLGASLNEPGIISTTMPAAFPKDLMLCLGHSCFDTSIQCFLNSWPFLCFFRDGNFKNCWFVSFMWTFNWNLSSTKMLFLDEVSSGWFDRTRNRQVKLQSLLRHVYVCSLRLMRFIWLIRFETRPSRHRLPNSLMTGLRVYGIFKYKNNRPCIQN